MADKMMATFMEDYLWRTIYKGQLWKLNYGRLNDGNYGREM